MPLFEDLKLKKEEGIREGSYLAIGI